jgi:putative ABC transport system permease protein
MIRNYLKTALRIMLRQKAYSAINIIGLSIGIAATLIIISYIADEVSYDKFHANSDRIYRLGFTGRLQGNEFNMSVSPAPVAEAMQKEIPEVEEAVRFGIWRTMPMSFEEKNFTEQYMVVADSNFFSFFSFPVVHGDLKNFLKGPNKLVITESAVTRYFGNENPIGKIMLRGSEKTTCEVVGVVKDAPRNSHIDFDMILSGESWDYLKTNTQWTNNNIYTYFRLQPGADVAKVKAQLNGMMEKYGGSELEKFIGMTFKQFREQGNNIGLTVIPMLDIHLKSNSLQNEIKPGGNIQYLYIFGAIAAFIILIACINFMNLSTARSANRAKEVGVRKTIGAFRERLIFQFISESLLYSFLSMIIAIGIVAVSLDAFNTILGKNLNMNEYANPVIIGGLLLFTVVIGLLAGSYPAFYLTAFKPTEVLKGKIRSGFKNSSLRNGLVVIQFVVSIALIFGTLVVYRQMEYLQNKSLGFEKENVIGLLHTLSLENAEGFRNEIVANPAFKSASFSNNLPPNISWNSAFRKGGSEEDYILYVYQADEDHLATMGYEMAEGRFFSREFKTDTAAIILNEAAYKQMGFKNLEEAIVLSYQGPTPVPLKVIGVLKDFNYHSLKDKVQPMAMLLGRSPNFEMAIRLNPGNTQQQIAELEKIWKKHTSGAPFEYSFLDQNFDALFRSEQRMGQVILVFTTLAIGIACLGLFGLAAYTAEQRAKEISIRKVMGASASQMVVLMSRDFTLLILVAFFIATPLAWYFLNSWLEGFANRIVIDASFVIISGTIAFVIAFITMSFQSIRAARENPVKAMRSE